MSSVAVILVLYKLLVSFKIGKLYLQTSGFVFLKSFLMGQEQYHVGVLYIVYVIG